MGSIFFIEPPSNNKPAKINWSAVVPLETTEHKNPKYDEKKKEKKRDKHEGRKKERNSGLSAGRVAISPNFETNKLKVTYQLY